jgi:hypothetical protein
MMKIDLDKVERLAPELVGLVKSSQLNLDKHELNEHTARVALMLDISGSMGHLFTTGKVNELIKRALPLALQFDDDGQIDVFCFNNNAYEVGEYGLSNYKECVRDIERQFGVNGGTSYNSALDLIKEHYAGSKLPVYVMFITDGDTDNKSKVEKSMISISKQPIFIQFIGLGTDYFPDADGPTEEAPAAKPSFLARLFGMGPDIDQQSSHKKKNRSLSSGFSFLAGLDEMGGRKVDNANFFALKHPTSVSDDRLYSLLLNEYPQWLKDARAASILK